MNMLLHEVKPHRWLICDLLHHLRYRILNWHETIHLVENSDNNLIPACSLKPSQLIYKTAQRMAHLICWQQQLHVLTKLVSKCFDLRICLLSLIYEWNWSCLPSRQLDDLIAPIILFHTFWCGSCTKNYTPKKWTLKPTSLERIFACRVMNPRHIDPNNQSIQ